MEKNKTGKYLKYAIGEIILVVIGILIALSINNWNENRKNEQILKNIYSIIVEDLNNDIDEIDALIKIKKHWEPTFLKVIDGEMTKEDYENCPDCAYIIMGYGEFSMDQEGNKLLNVHGSLSNVKEDDLSLKITQFYSDQLTHIYADESFKQNDLYSNYSDWKNNYSWYPEHVLRRESNGFIEYALNDQDYKNRVSNYYLINYMAALSRYEEFKEKASTILSLIQKRLDD